MNPRARLVAGVAAAALQAGHAVAQPLSASTDNVEVVFDAGRIRRAADGRVVADRGVRALVGARTMRAEQVIFDPVTGLITASGDVAIREPDGSFTFAESLALTDDLREGVAINFAALFPNDARLSAAAAERSGGDSHSLDRVTYSPCPVCLDENDKPGAPFWRLRARRAEQRADEGVIVYRDVFFDILGTPIFYAPALSHADPSVKRKSGFLTPRVGQSTELGVFAEIPYYLALSPSYDVTIALNPTTEAGVVTKADWRHRLYSGDYRLRGSFLRFDDDRTLAEPTPNTRWHVFGDGQFQIRPNWRWGFDIERTSDDTYVRRYNIEQPVQRRGAPAVDPGNRLETDVYLEGQSENFFFLGEGFLFQSLRAGDEDDVAPQVFPNVTLQRSFRSPGIGGRVDLNANWLALRRPAGLDMSRLSGGVAWERRFTIGPGVRVRPFLEARADVYFTEPEDADSDILGRALPTVGVEASWPFVKRGRAGRLILEPVALVAASPIGGDPDGLPNEDSTFIEFDATNLLRVSRAPGLDVWEDGQRVALAVRARGRRGGLSGRALAGRLFRLQESSPYAAETGLADRGSDYVARTEATWRDRIRLTAGARLAPDDFALRRADVTAQLRFGRADLRGSYVRLDADPTAGGLNVREEVTLGGRFRITDRWALTGDMRQDLETSTLVNAVFGVEYQNDCAFFAFGLTRDGTRDRDLEPETSVLFRVGLKTLGAFGNR